MQNPKNWQKEVTPLKKSVPRDEGIIDITGRTVTLKDIEGIEEFGFNSF